MALAETAAAEPAPIEQSWPQAAGRARGHVLELAAAAAALAIEGVLHATALGRQMPLPLLPLTHLLVCAGLVWLIRLRMRAGSDTIPALIVAILTAIAGPIGALVAFAGVLLHAHARPHQELLAAWYDRISLSLDTDPVQRLCDSVAIGRSLDLLAPPPRSFTQVIERGTLAERQIVLGHIARHFSPQYAPALHAALKSEEPVIRVQAAAVAARVREKLQARVETLIAAAERGFAEPLAALEAAAELGASAATGLLDDVARSGAEATAAALHRASLSTPTRTAGQILSSLADERRRRGAAAARRLIADIEAQLIGAAQYARLRDLRRLSPVLGRAKYTLRKARGGSRRQSLAGGRP